MFLLVLLLTATSSIAHITLTFPEARYPPLDFLDSARTVGQCGIPKSDRSVYSTLKTGLKYNVTWRLQYPHQGGYRLILVDYLGNTVEQLAPSRSGSENTTQFDGLQDQSSEWKEVEINTACPNCTLILERQALEWGPSYKFRSCAEVHVVEVPPTLDKQCMERGMLMEEGVCKCFHGYSGSTCQYEDDCSADKDCWNGGRCVEDGVFPNKKSCFCHYGFFGKTCKEKSGSVFEDDECFNHLNSKEVKNLKYEMFDPNCYKQHNFTKTDFLYTRVLKDELEIIMDYETESYVALGWRPSNIPRSCRLFPDLSKGNEDTRVGGKTSGYAQSALDSALHSMDCTDIVMASVVHGDFLHVEDMYTRDRSTPITDNILDGEQSLLSAYGIQRNGRTVVMIRRLIREIEPSDHPLGPGLIHVIHSKGQQKGAYKHITPSAIEKEAVKIKDFYKEDQWRYHGSANRGTHLFEFVTVSEIENSRTFIPHKALKRPQSTNSQFREQILPRPSTSTSTVVLIDPNEDEDQNTSESRNPEPSTTVTAPEPILVTGTERPIDVSSSSTTTTTNENSSNNAQVSIVLFILTLFVFYAL